MLVLSGLIWQVAGVPPGVEADHGVARCGNTGMKACLSAASPFVTRVVKPGGVMTWCVNPRGDQYTDFRNQVRKVMGVWASELRATPQEVAYPQNPTSTDCLVRNDMIDNHPCGDCGAWVWTQNYPVLVEYNARAGYVRWESTIGHEYGHAFCLLDEFYDKVNFRSFILTYSYWIDGYPTVMDIGSWLLAAFAPLGIWGPTRGDLDRCAETLGRAVGVPPPPPPCGLGPAVEWGGRYDSCSGRWIAPDGWQFDPALGNCGAWYRPDGVLEWAACDFSWEGRWNDAIKRWVGRDGSMLDPATGIWSRLP